MPRPSLALSSYICGRQDRVWTHHKSHYPNACLLHGTIFLVLKAMPNFLFLCIITEKHFSLNSEELRKRKIMLIYHACTVALSMRTKHPLLEGSAHIFPYGEKVNTSKDASLMQEESFFIILGFSLFDINICTVEVATIAAINTFLKNSPCLSIPPNSTDLSKSITHAFALAGKMGLHYQSENVF